VIYFYADTSGKASNPVMVAAGYLGTQEQWTNFGKQWSNTLLAAKVKEFHATDFFSFRGEFAGWDQDMKKHIRFAKRFTAIAETHTAYGMARAIEVESFRKLIEPELAGMLTPHNRFTPLMFCLLTCLYGVAHVPRPRGELITVIIEGEPGIGEVIDYLNWLKAKDQEWLRAFSSLAPGDKRLLPLQGADLLAHECWRYVNESLNPTGRPKPRKSLKRLLQGHRVRLQTASFESLKPTIPALREYLRQHPSGV
jgi:hypothetical protein